MTPTIYYIFAAFITLGVLTGIYMMSRVQTAVQGNALSAICIGLAIILTLYTYDLLTLGSLWIGLFIGSFIGIWGANKVQMIQMPQAVALLNGLGGAASALVGIVSLIDGNMDAFARATAGLAVCVGMITLTGSLVAAGKLHRLISQRSVVLPFHQTLAGFCLLLSLVSVIAMIFTYSNNLLLGLICFITSSLFGIIFAIRVGGADMPITISLLNSLSGVAGSIAGMAISDPLLVAIGGVVGASGLLLTQVMCRAMNRSLSSILLGATSVRTTVKQEKISLPEIEKITIKETKVLSVEEEATDNLKNAKNIVIIPGYGMAQAQAQSLVKQVSDTLEQQGKEVIFAIHPVAGRMSGHMNVLLAEVDVPYEKLWELDDANPKLAEADIALIIGANDVVNPAANTAEDTPIYGMPILDAYKAKNVIVCNFDTQPGYAGVPNSLYENDNTTMLLGDAKETLTKILQNINN